MPHTPVVGCAPTWSAAAVVGRINTVVKRPQLAKVHSPIVVTDSGMVMLANELHLAKARYPMAVTESGMVMLANELHPSKALLSIMVTRSGMVMLTNEAHS